jgi:ABC-type nitrate/sulfonate/bicarbonate transport system substrate-binding protein
MIKSPFEEANEFNLKRRDLLALGGAGVLAGAGAALGMSSAHAQDPTRIKVAWQPQWAGTAYYVHALKHTDILKKYGLTVEWVPFVAGGPAIAALASDSIDVGYIGDAPAVFLLARANNARLVGHLVDHHAALFVKGGSSVKSLNDLAGKKVATFYGAGVHALVVRWFQQISMRPGEQFTLLNLGLAEALQALLMGEIDAAMIWGSAAQEARDRGDIRVLREAPEPCPIVMTNNFIGKRRDHAEKFLAAHTEAVLFTATHKELVNRWAGSNVGLKDPRVFEFDIQLDRNFGAKSIRDVKLDITASDLAEYEALVAFLAREKAIPRAPKIADAYDSSILAGARKHIDINAYDASQVKILQQGA